MQYHLAPTAGKASCTSRFRLDAESLIEIRHQFWTIIYPNISLWYDVWEEYVFSSKGFAYKAGDGSVQFFQFYKNMMYRIINLDETKLSLDETTQENLASTSKDQPIDSIIASFCHG
jgi:hypothetical protein